MKTAWAVVVAAGQGTRLGATAPKALVSLAGKPMLWHSLAAIAETDLFDGCVVACGAGWIEHADVLVGERFGKHGRTVAGGESRQESVRRALDRISAKATSVIVHDAARPLASADLFRRAMSALERGAGAICAVPVTDTIKKANGDVVTGTLSRSGLWRAQTPQAFRLDVLLRAHAEAAAAGFVGTDDAALLERIGEAVIVVPGDERNVKVTTPGDVRLAEALLERTARR